MQPNQPTISPQPATNQAGPALNAQPAPAPTPPAPPPTTVPQPVSTIQAPSQAELQPTTNSLTSTNVNQMTAEAPSATPQPATAPVAIPQQPPAMTAGQPVPQPPMQPQPQPQRVRPPQPQPRPQPAQPRKLTKEQQEKLKSAQNSLLISEIRENMVIMSDGSFRAVVACESINYDLMSSEERDGIEYSYQNFINTLYFPVQIIIQSRKIDLKPYLQKLEKIRGAQDNMLLGVLMDEYLDFIFDISQQANIMRKDFFAVVPYYLSGDVDSAVNSFKNLSEGLISSVQKPQNIKITAKDYEKAKDEIRNRVGVVLSGLMNMGVRAGQLPTKALSELFYNYYNPDTAIDQPIGDFRDYAGLFVRKAEGEAPNRIGGIE
ncbi:MAG: hypothetical protein LBC95_01385 [Candidatus Nomurabacteria bacterium]|jgi:hypothetical protein|nr:hypothetical protein [Candidatus Nomurabacteria bacterium]